MARVNTGSISAALDTLHGARRLPPREAVERLRSFSETISPPGHEGKSPTDARVALDALIASLEKDGSATDDVWQGAIEKMTSLANDPE